MKKQHVIHLFADFLSGSLTDEMYVEVAAHLDVCGSCSAAHDALFDHKNAGELFMFAPPIPPPPQLRGLVLSQFDGGQKYTMFTRDVAEILALEDTQVAALFDQLDDLAHWQQGPTPGCYLMPVKSSRKAAFTGFIRLDPGHAFPEHAHHGQEHLFLVAGGYTDDAGNVMQAGEHDIHDDGTCHTITAMEWVPCICALVVEKGFTFIGDEASASS